MGCASPGICGGSSTIAAEFTPNERAYAQAEDMQQRAQRGKAGAQGRDPRSLSRHDVHRRGSATETAFGPIPSSLRRCGLAK